MPEEIDTSRLAHQLEFQQNLCDTPRSYFVIGHASDAASKPRNNWYQRRSLKYQPKIRYIQNGLYTPPKPTAPSLYRFNNPVETCSNWGPFIHSRTKSLHLESLGKGVTRRGIHHVSHLPEHDYPMGRENRTENQGESLTHIFE